MFIIKAPRFAYPRPNCLQLFAFSAIFSVGYDENPTMISCAMISILTALRNDSISKTFQSKNPKRLSDARLQAESSKCMYSLHGFEPLILPVLGQVCHLLMVESNWIPGSAQFHVASAIRRIKSFALTVSAISPVRTIRKCQSLSSATASMNSSETLTELLAF